jgi:hypothetical protein
MFPNLIEAYPFEEVYELGKKTQRIFPHFFEAKGVQAFACTHKVGAWC